MTETEILAHAEAMANWTHSHPTEADFAAAEAEVRFMLDQGMTYSEQEGWTNA